MSLNNASSLTVDSIAPNVSQDIVVTLRLIATVNRGAIGYDDVSITIKDGSLSSGILNDTGLLVALMLIVTGKFVLLLITQGKMLSMEETTRSLWGTFQAGWC